MRCLTEFTGFRPPNLVLGRGLLGGASSVCGQTPESSYFHMLT